MSLDGRLALPGGAPVLLSPPEDLRRVHRLRASCDAVLVGIGTVLADDPSLLAKEEWAGPVPRQPARVVLDTNGRIPPSARVLDGRAPCYVLTVAPAALAAKRGKAVAVPAGPGGLDLKVALAALSELGIRRLMVEGGGRVLSRFLAEDLVDTMTLYVAPRLIGPDAPGLADGWAPEAAFGLELRTVERLGEGSLLTLGRRNHEVPRR